MDLFVSHDVVFQRSCVSISAMALPYVRSERHGTAVPIVQRSLRRAICSRRRVGRHMGRPVVGTSTGNDAVPASRHGFRRCSAMAAASSRAGAIASPIRNTADPAAVGLISREPPRLSQGRAVGHGRHSNGKPAESRRGRTASSLRRAARPRSHVTSTAPYLAEFRSASAWRKRAHGRLSHEVARARVLA